MPPCARPGAWHSPTPLLSPTCCLPVLTSVTVMVTFLKCRSPPVLPNTVSSIVCRLKEHILQPCFRPSGPRSPSLACTPHCSHPEAGTLVPLPGTLGGPLPALILQPNSPPHPSKLNSWAGSPIPESPTEGRLTLCVLCCSRSCVGLGRVFSHRPASH